MGRRSFLSVCDAPSTAPKWEFPEGRNGVRTKARFALTFHTSGRLFAFFFFLFFSNLELLRPLLLEEKLVMLIYVQN